MGVRILCLHGMGVNADIFKVQTACFRKLLPLDYEFVFLQGLAECEPAPGVAAFFPGPYRCWYDTPTSTKVKKAHVAVLDYIKAFGPFDGVMGFSQGAAVAASILLHHQLDGLSPPFRLGIFICSPLPFSHSLNHGIDARAYFGSPTDVVVRRDCPNEVPAHLITDEKYLRGEERLAAAGLSTTAPTQASFYQMFHPTVDHVRVTIPTVHITGARDRWRRHSLDVAMLCSAELAVSFEHTGGHEIPPAFAEDMCDLIEGVVSVAMAV
ncbi:serine hydrolase FSH [Macrophomina phaseolina]|uniref:Serine hydrolase FSH n=1 Tax=Macrophomina phaseolina TaxID=35725 RepID=A0ABQ8FX33_9PEZI|nr:serine hydrolase FSH [Macrophomina phaseolina]